MKNTDARMERLDMELAAIDGAISELRYLDFHPSNGSWSKHCAAFRRMLGERLDRGEYQLGNKSL